MLSKLKKVHLLNLSFTAIVFLLSQGARAQYFENQQKSFEIWAGYSISVESYNLSSQSGFSTNTPQNSGNTISGTMIWHRQEASYQLDYSSQSQKLDVPSSLVPKSADSQLYRTIFTMTPHAASTTYGSSYGSDSSKSGLQWNYGLEYRQRTASYTYPNTLSPSYIEFGPRAGFGTDFKLTQNLTFETGMGLYFPVFKDERSSKTGYSLLTLSPDAYGNFVYQLTPLIETAIGLSVLYERAQYSGTGDRGTTNGTETFWDYNIPFTLRFSF